MSTVVNRLTAARARLADAMDVLLDDAAGRGQTLTEDLLVEQVAVEFPELWREFVAASCAATMEQIDASLPFLEAAVDEACAGGAR